MPVTVTQSPTLPGLQPVRGPAAAAWRAFVAHPRTTGRWPEPLIDRIATLASAAGIRPDDLAGPELHDTGWAELADRHQWAPATLTLYCKAARQAGIAAPVPPTGEPVPGPRSLPALYDPPPTASADEIRSAAWLRVAAGWPAPIAWWCLLRAEQLTVEGDDVFLAVDRPVRVLGAGPAWQAWTVRRSAAGHPPDGPALTALRAAPGARRRDRALAERTLEAAFTRQSARATARLAEHAASGRPGAERAAQLHPVYDTLTYDTYRRLLLAAGAPPATARGAVRAARHPARPQ